MELYNAMNGTHYDNADVLEITTLENAIYMNVKNDVSFVLGLDLNIYEHQSTLNPNIPLRDLIYVSKVLQGIVKDENLYGIKKVSIPEPRFVVFYNGESEEAESWTRKLSELYEVQREDPELELKVQVININYGKNRELMEACRSLKEYAQFVAMVREKAQKKKFDEAVEEAVEECIKLDILKEFLMKHRAEAIEMCIFEYDEEKHMKSEREYWKEVGEKEGMEKGMEMVKRVWIMSKNGVSKAEIARSVGISEKEVDEIVLKLSSVD